MPIEIVRNDITKMETDAIVNAARPSLLGGGGVDGAIHRAAGPGLLEECRTLGGCRTGQAKITGGYELPAKFIIHTVGPIWEGGHSGEEELLASCYRSSLDLALENGCETVAFPLISAGAYGYPKDEALRVAVDSIGKFLLDHDMTVYIVVFSRESVQLGRKLSDEITEYIDDNYTPLRQDRIRDRRREVAEDAAYIKAEEVETDFLPPMAAEPTMAPRPAKADKTEAVPSERNATVDEDFFERLRNLDESFQQMLLRMIDEAGMTDVQCYKKANIDRKLFSKIRADKHYRPSKKTALALAVALELDLPQTKELLEKAGFALSHSSIFDVIVEYFIVKRNYNIFEINEALFAYDQVTLG